MVGCLKSPCVLSWIQTMMLFMSQTQLKTQGQAQGGWGRIQHGIQGNSRSASSGRASSYVSSGRLSHQGHCNFGAEPSGHRARGTVSTQPSLTLLLQMAMSTRSRGPHILQQATPFPTHPSPAISSTSLGSSSPWASSCLILLLCGNGKGSGLRILQHCK